MGVWNSARRKCLSRAAAAMLAFGCSPSLRGEPPEQTSAVLDIVPTHGEVWASELVMHGGAPDAELSRCRLVGGAAADVPVAVAGRQWSARLPLFPGDNSIVAKCTDARGVERTSDVAVLRRMVPAVRPLVKREPVGVDARDAVVYGVAPALFGTPPLRAVTDALPELADLGVDILWLAPVFENVARDYGYAVTGYRDVRADFGTRSDLTTLVDEAHRHGLRVVLDFVPNHTSIAHRYFEDARAWGPRSHYWSFYDRTTDGNFTHYFDWKHLANLDYRNDEVANWMIDNARLWVEEVGVDGYRIDAAWGLQRRRADFVDRFRDALRASDPRVLLFPEASARDPFWKEHGFDAAYDWTDTLGEWSWEHAFDERDGIGDRLDETVKKAPRDVLRFLENNDTGVRFVTRHGLGMTRAAAGALFTLPGTPTMFTGQEVGAEFEPYAQATPPSREDRHRLREHYRSLIALRRRLPALRSDDYARIELPASRVFAYRRGKGDEAAIVLVHFDDTNTRVRISLPEPLRASTSWSNALTNEPVRARGGAVDVALEPWQVVVLAPRPRGRVTPRGRDRVTGAE